MKILLVSHGGHPTVMALAALMGLDHEVFLALPSEVHAGDPAGYDGLVLLDDRFPRSSWVRMIERDCWRLGVPCWTNSLPTELTNKLQERNKLDQEDEMGSLVLTSSAV